MERPDDAGVYKISEDLAIIQTVDFFTPIVDDPYSFGQIAAANAMSDIYAMGGIPKTAMNLVAFPIKKMPVTVLRQILQGGIDKMIEAGVVLVGGHSIEDNELKYGLSVTGFIHPSKILIKGNLHVGDRLILTKPLGTGIINTAIKANLVSDRVVQKVIRTMAELNKTAAEVMQKFSVHACTDITGFGLLGHMAEMVIGSGKGIQIVADQLPVIPEALEFATMGLIPAGAYRNRDFRQHMVEIAPTVPLPIQDVLFDPQTSGGLLICIDGCAADQLLYHLRTAGINDAAMIGTVIKEPKEKIIVI